jgi:hypothetical protein
MKNVFYIKDIFASVPMNITEKIVLGEVSASVAKRTKDNLISLTCLLVSFVHVSFSIPIAIILIIKAWVNLTVTVNAFYWT